MDPYRNREEYRSLVSRSDLMFGRVTVKETDLLIGAECGFEEAALSAVRKVRKMIRDEIRKRPAFQTSLVPVEPDGSEPEPVLRMMLAAKKAGTGPMAAVAGLVSEYTGRKLLTLSREVIVENGGDIFLSGNEERTVAVAAGTSPLTGRIGIRVLPGDGYGVCTSSGTYGHSLSFGKADAAVVLASDAALSDAVATMLGNKCTDADALEDAVEWAMTVDGVDGAIAIIGDRIAMAGDAAGRIVSIEQEGSSC